MPLSFAVLALVVGSIDIVVSSIGQQRQRWDTLRISLSCALH